MGRKGGGIARGCGLLCLVLSIGSSALAADDSAAPSRFVAGAVNYSPWYIEHPSDDTRPGAVVEMTRVLANRTGIAVEIEPQPNARLMQSLKDGTIDFTLGLDQPIFHQISIDCGELGTIEGAVISLASAPIRSIADLAGKRLGMVRAYRIETILGPDTGAEDVPTDDLPQATRMLTAGRLDALLLNDVALRSFVTASPAFAALLAPPLKMPSQHAHVWVSMVSPLKDRCDALKQTAAAIRAEGLLDRVIQHY